MMILKKLKVGTVCTLLLAAALLFGKMSFAQAEKGMHFEHGLSWQQVLEKAKKENKFIFVDCYTTWCGPCKMMSAQVFPLEEVGTFYNDKYIMVKVQLDTTKNDNEEVKSWFATGKELADKYNVRAYPTYLFFDTDGQIVHRAVGSSDPAAFVAKGKNALDKETQYYTAKRLYEAGNKEEALLLKLATLSTEGYDQPFAAQVSQEYLATQKDLLTEGNIKLLSGTIKKSTDPGFKELLANPTLFDKYNYPGFATQTIRSTIIREEIYPVIAPMGAKPSATPDWKTATANATKKYPAYAAEAVAFTKIFVAKQSNNWPVFSAAVSDYLKAYSANATPQVLNEYAWTIFEKCDDKACIEKALAWSKQSLVGNEKQDALIDTYANLLHKAGKTKEAIEWETKAQALTATNGVSAYDETIDKMKKGEKTW